MATKTWNGSNDSFSNAADWSPAMVPTSGDIAVINSGTVSLTTSLAGVAIQLTQAAGSTSSTGLSITNATLDASSPLTVTNSNTYTAVAPTISIAGAVTLNATDAFYGSKIVFSISAGSTLVNAGTMNFYSSSLVTNGTGTLQNSGTIAIVNPGNTTQVPVVATPITGTGTIALGKFGQLELSSSVAAGQTIVMNDGASGSETLQLDQVGSFGATINGFSSSDLISVTNTPYTNASYMSTGANSGVLSLFSGATLEGTISFTGQYTLGSFVFTPNNFGGGLSNLQITTTAVNAVSSGLPAGYQNGGNGTGSGTTVGAVYRFFDKIHGTHFFTSDVGERNNVINTLSASYSEETNGFGDVAQSDPNAVAVYRFFDTNFGTHFFTASSTERDTVIATRPDLTYEPSSTFYEHLTLQTGDTPVYRLFDQTTGTQFLTGNQSEYAGITTPGTATYRADLHSEGVAFYAPTGSFT